MNNRNIEDNSCASSQSSIKCASDNHDDTYVDHVTGATSDRDHYAVLYDYQEIYHPSIPMVYQNNAAETSGQELSSNADCFVETNSQTNQSQIELQNVYHFNNSQDFSTNGELNYCRCISFDNITQGSSSNVRNNDNEAHSCVSSLSGSSYSPSDSSSPPLLFECNECRICSGLNTSQLSTYGDISSNNTNIDQDYNYINDATDLYNINNQDIFDDPELYNYSDQNGLYNAPIDNNNFGNQCNVDFSNNGTNSNNTCYGSSLTPNYNFSNGFSNACSTSACIQADDNIVEEQLNNTNNNNKGKGKEKFKNAPRNSNAANGKNKNTKGKGRAKESLSKPKTCHLCLMKLGRPQDLKRHIKTVHDKSKPFRCDYCNKSFGRRDALIRHLCIHCKCKKQKLNRKNDKKN